METPTSPEVPMDAEQCGEPAEVATRTAAGARPAFSLGGTTVVGRLGFGTGGLVGPGYWGPRHEDPERAVAVLRRAVDRGVTLIDTADNYGPDVAEELVARALHPYPEGLVLATKGGVVRTGPDVWHIAGRPEQLRAMCEASLRRLRTDTLDLYQLHRLDPEVPMADQLGTLLELQQAGKIRHIGLDSIDADQLARARALAPIASVQNRYNLLDRTSEDVLKLCEQTGTAFLPWFPLGNGRLTGGGNGRSPRGVGAAATVGSAGSVGPAGTVGRPVGPTDALASVAAAHGATIGQIALAWLLHRSPVLLPTPGTGSPAHLDENLAAARVSLTEEELARLDGLGGLEGLDGPSTTTTRRERPRR
ncbi:aldo/keto reductase [Streptomyces sp. MspMP-M5]|uniref:aldo/keto reductase n=1 Tax=unclassified Streptomyces TaxID=2593676 RepID=UPI002D21C0AE|nr:aldo/keto reductase [Streptomyces sp. MspMP-M5]